MTRFPQKGGGGAIVAQRTLDVSNVAEFYHDNFVTDQINDFRDLVIAEGRPSRVVADIGGGCGFFASGLAKNFALKTRVLDTDPGSLAACREAGVDAASTDALSPEFQGDEEIVCFNLILHHLVGETEQVTRALQRRAVEAWQGRCERIFVNEYIYDTPVASGLSARLIYEITSSGILSKLARAASKIIPSLRANTFGVGVRFRTASDWHLLFDEAGFRVIGYRRGYEEPVSVPRRLLGIRSSRRDSFVLAAANG